MIDITKAALTATLIAALNDSQMALADRKVADAKGYTARALKSVNDALALAAQPVLSGFDAYEIKPVVEIGNRDSERGHCESYETEAEAIRARDDAGGDARLFWSLYGHVAGEGVHCIGDFSQPDSAVEIADRIIDGRQIPLHVFG